jgi:ubiquinone/menaquinone biosynthesis C-methylase UbiE
VPFTTERNLNTVKRIWPKKVPELSPEQLAAREKWMQLWHEILPNKYGVIEKFNHGYPASKQVKEGSKTLEIGAGLGEHAKWEDLNQQDYYFLEYRRSFCESLRKSHPADKVICGDIQAQLNFEAGSFDRIIAIHVLEHLPNLPSALTEIKRLLKNDGVFDIVIPCEGGLAYEFARKISSERLFKKNFKMEYMPIAKAEHINNYSEIIDELKKAEFQFADQRFFPLLVPISNLNLCFGARLKMASK